MNVIKDLAFTAQDLERFCLAMHQMQLEWIEMMKAGMIEFDEYEIVE